MFGQLQIVPSADLGELGAQQGEAASYDWKWYYSAPGSLIWLVLILAVLVPKANHNLRVLWIAVPLAVLNLLWWAFQEISGMPSVPASQFDTLFQSAVIGVAVLWLVADYFDRFAGFVRFLVSLGTLVAVSCLGVLSYSFELSNETALFLALFVFLAIAMLAAIALSRRLCGGKYLPARFMLWLALWMTLGSLVALFGFIVVGSIIMSGGPNLSEGILIVILGGFILGLGLYVLNFPFMMLGFVNPFFRGRFCACLGLKSMPGGLTSGPSTEEKTEVASFCEEN